MNVGALVQTAMNAVPSDLKARVTFTSTAPGTHNPTTDTFSAPVAVTVSGTASRDQGDPKRYAKLNLKESEAPTLIFVPDVIGELPDLDYTTVWGGETFVVKDVDPISPAGIAFAASIVVAN